MAQPTRFPLSARAAASWHWTRTGTARSTTAANCSAPPAATAFQELAAYDQDKNSWIDENDAVYAQLKVWTKDGSGNDALSTLAQKNVGAIYLGNVGTPFDIKNGQNQLDGQIKSSGVYLNENGGVGTIQQIDLAV